MKLQCSMDLAVKTETSDKCSEGDGIRLKTTLENLGQYRKSRGELTKMAVTIDQDVQSNHVRRRIQFVRKGNGSVVMFHLHEGS